MKKVCNTCEKEKNLSEFRKDRTRKDGYDYACKVCRRQYHKSAYMKKYGPKVRESNRKNREKNLQLIFEYKSERCCKFCSESDPVCLEFHHKNPDEKKFGISNGLQYKWNKIFNEIKKCVLVCSNCHKKIHAGKITLH
jgi:hypothetical protein